MAGAVGSVSSRPAQMVTGWLSNQVAPKYWAPDSTITVSLTYLLNGGLSHISKCCVQISAMISLYVGVWRVQAIVPSPHD